MYVFSVGKEVDIIDYWFVLTSISGHVSYNCPKNTLGDREKPSKDKRVFKRKAGPPRGDTKSQKEEEERYNIVSLIYRYSSLW
jgi:hypothetical protein